MAAVNINIPTVYQLIKPTFASLCGYMRNRTEVILTNKIDGQKYQGKITGIRLEDGSGKKWLVKIDSREQELFIVTE